MRLTATGIFWILPLLWLPSCAGRQPVDGLVVYRPKEPVVIAAPAAGLYSLHSLEAAAPRITVKLMQGDRLGFEPGANGIIVAVAASYEFPLDAAGTHYWRVEG
jgi:hypothetical protein